MRRCASLSRALQVNAYEPGEGILPHQDGPLYYPAVAIVSLGAGAVMKFTPHSSLRESSGDAAAPPPQGARVWLPRRSLLLFAEEAYTAYLHGIPADGEQDDVRSGADGAADEDERGDGTRVSLTCRSVLKVRRNLLPTRA
jgi:alkylated DNA repair protein alkB family protein 6